MRRTLATTIALIIMAYAMNSNDALAGKKKPVDEIRWCTTVKEVLGQARERACPIMFVFCDNSTYAVIKKEFMDNKDMVVDSKKFAMLLINVDEETAERAEFEKRFKYDLRMFPAVSFADSGAEIKREWDCVGPGNVLYTAGGKGPYLKDAIKKALDTYKEGLDADNYYEINDLISDFEQKWEEMNFKDAIESLKDACKVKIDETYLSKPKNRLAKIEAEAKAKLDDAGKKEAAKDYIGAAEIYCEVSLYEGLEASAAAKKKMSALKGNAEAKDGVAEGEKNFRAMKAMNKAAMFIKKGDKRNAITEYESIVKSFPGTKFADQAAEKLKELKKK